MLSFDKFIDKNETISGMISVRLRTIIYGEFCSREYSYLYNMINKDIIDIEEKIQFLEELDKLFNEYQLYCKAYNKNKIQLIKNRSNFDCNKLELLPDDIKTNIQSYFKADDVKIIRAYSITSNIYNKNDFWNLNYLRDYYKIVPKNIIMKILKKHHFIYWEEENRNIVWKDNLETILTYLSCQISKVYKYKNSIELIRIDGMYVLMMDVSKILIELEIFRNLMIDLKTNKKQNTDLIKKLKNSL
jgi:hypothetical protein